MSDSPHLTEKAEWMPLCEAQEPSPRPGFVPAGGCWRERGHDGDHLWTPEVGNSPATTDGESDG